MLKVIMFFVTLAQNKFVFFYFIGFLKGTEHNVFKNVAWKANPLT